MYGITAFRVFFLGWIATVGCIPFHEGHSHRDFKENFIGRGTNELATALLKGFVHTEENQVYSPFGYSAILAIFSEGARGASREQIANAFHYPKDVESFREAYRTVLERFLRKKQPNSPEFKNWFYIYKNYTIEEELQKVLRKYYFTEIKSVNRPEDYIKDHKRTPIKESVNSDKTMEPSKPELLSGETQTQTQHKQEVQKSEGSKPEILMSEGITNKPEVQLKEEIHQKSEVTKEVHHAPEVTKEETKIEKVIMKNFVKPLGRSMDLLKGEDIVKPVHEPMETQEPMKIIPEEKTKIEEPMQQAEESASSSTTITTSVEKEAPMNMEERGPAPGESHTSETSITEQGTKTVSGGESMMAPIKTSAEDGLSPIEHFSGMTDSSLRIKGKDSSHRMVIFNGLYYKGEWETPFVKKPADDSRVFYKSDTEKIFVSTLHSQGVFNVGNIAGLDSRAIELPYKGGRYSLLILIPNSKDGLTKLISDLSDYKFNNIFDELTEKQVDVCLPSFEINTISKPVSSTKKLGLTKITNIFDPDKADLSGISNKDSGLFVEELVQMVTFKVDADYSKANFLTASIASSRSNIQNFQINQPFLFYLRDNLENIIIVNGKVIDPTPKPAFYFS